LHFTPAGQETVVRVESNWPSPRFQGHWLPGERVTRADGFTASWAIPFLGRNQVDAWSSASAHSARELDAASFGVDFIMPVDAHRMADRSVKYARLFTLLTFAAIWLIGRDDDVGDPAHRLVQADTSGTA
jgi:inner membrane protein